MMTKSPDNILAQYVLSTKCVIASHVFHNNLSDHVYLFLVILLIFKVSRNKLSGHVYVFHVVMTCYTSTSQHKKTRPCKHYRNIRGVQRRFRIKQIFTNDVDNQGD